MLPQVKEAMLAASHQFVNMDDLMHGVGQRLAELTGAEWGMVSSGAAAALCHATAACVTGGDPEKMLRLPNTAGLKNRVVMMDDGRFTYDQAIRTVGVEVVNVTPDTLADALDDRVALVALLGSREATRLDVFEKTVALAKSRGIPVLVDAASEHLQNPDPYLTRGATMVAYSGGKYLRGPQPTGLLLGEKKWVQTAWCCAAPHHTLGRTMKVGREEVMGLLAAVEHWALARDHAREKAEWELDLKIIKKVVERVDTVTTEVMPGESVRSPVPRLEIRWDAQKMGVSGLQLRDELLAGDPCIMLDDRGATDGSVLILPFSLQLGDAIIVGERIQAVLAAASEPVVKDDPDPVNVSGTWEIRIAFTDSEAVHQLVIEQDQSALKGTLETLFLEGTLSGSVVGNELNVASQIRYEGTHLAYRFIGTVDGDSARGFVELGSSGQSAPGPLNQREYGKAEWVGKRVRQ
jgi:L-seryl-tRNA(Ser) seleniumtransferase